MLNSECAILVSVRRLDFGLVLSRAGSDAAGLSAEGQVLGTLLYMARQQAASGREQDGRNDLYSLGAVAYYLLTGRPPFDGRGAIEMMIAHARDSVGPPSEGRADAPRIGSASCCGAWPRTRPRSSRMPMAWSMPRASAPAPGIETESGPCGGGKTPINLLQDPPESGGLADDFSEVVLGVDLLLHVDLLLVQLVLKCLYDPINRLRGRLNS
jgi:serine/threonine protein kinase